MKDKPLVHGRIVDLDILTFLDFPIKTLFEFQGWENIFSMPMVFYEPLIHLFYANLHSPKVGEIKYFVLGKRIFLDCKNFVCIFGIYFSEIMASSKNSQE